MGAPAWKVIAGPYDEPLSIEECRAHLEAPAYGDSDADTLDDTMIDGWISAAREHCEAFLGLSLSMRTIEAALDTFPTESADGDTAIELPMGPVVEIVQVTIGAVGEGTSGGSDDTQTLLDPTSYEVDDYRRPNLLVPTALTWPTGSGRNAVKIRYLAGYGVDSDGGTPMPKSIRAAMLLIVGHLYANREENTETALAALPLGVEALLRPHRVLLGFA